MKIGKAKVVRSVNWQRFLLTGTRLYEPVSARGRGARTPRRFLELRDLKTDLAGGFTGVVRAYHGGRKIPSEIVHFDVILGEDFIQIGCKKFYTGDAEAIRAAAKL